MSKVTQEFVDRVTAEDTPEGPDYIGPPPAETIEEAFKRLYVNRFIEKGFDVEDAIACFEAADRIYDDMTPVEAADEDMSYFEYDGDGPID